MTFNEAFKQNNLDFLWDNFEITGVKSTNYHNQKSSPY